MKDTIHQSIIANPEEIFRDLEGAEIPVPRENAESAPFELTLASDSMPKPLYDPEDQGHILTVLASQLETVDFAAKGVKETTGQMKQKHQLVVGCEHINEVARHNAWAICHNQGLTYVYNGDFWIKLDKDMLEGFLGKAFEQMGIAHVEAAGYSFKANALKQFLSSVYLPTPKRDINCTLVNLKNGTFEIVNGIGHLRLPRQEDFLKYQLPFAYDPAAKAPIWAKFLERVLPDPALQAIVAEFFGYIFISSKQLKLEKALLLYGTGANGKSVVHEVAMALFGRDNVSNFSLQNLTDTNGYYRMMIADKLVNYASEINGKLEASTFKQMVSGEPIEARLPYGNPTQIEDYAKFMFNCNELPHDVEHTNAFFRRFLIIPFNETIPVQEQDKELANKIIATELSGILNWVLEGLNRVLDQKGFTFSEVAENQIALYKAESDSVLFFMSENRYEPSADPYMFLNELYKDYRDYCKAEGNRYVSKRKFSQRLKANSFEMTRYSKGLVVLMKQAK